MEYFSRVLENTDGFGLYVGSKKYHWLPKSGFESAEKIDQFRDLARQHVKKCRFLAETTQ